MCGRFTLATPAQKLAEAFPWLEVSEAPPPRYNIAPTEAVAAVRNLGAPRLEQLRWGLIPWWADDPRLGNRLINARSESASQKPAFREALRKRRCLVLADGFYEWCRKVPYYVCLRERRPFALAGLWDTWRPTEGGEPVLSCTLLTTEANPLVASIHPRMPVILPPPVHSAWLAPGEISPRELERWLRPYPAEEMQLWRVSRRVNRPGYDAPELIEPG